VTRSADVQAYVKAALDAFGAIDCFHNNAGIEGRVAPTAEYDEAAFDAVMGVNAKGVFLGLRHVLPVMIRQGRGAVVNTASIAGLVGTAGMPAYVASKHAVIGLTKVAAGEVGPLGVRVNAVCPGPIATRMVRDIAKQVSPNNPGGVEERYAGLHPAAPLRHGGGGGEPRPVPVLGPRRQRHRGAVRGRWRADGSAGGRVAGQRRLKRPSARAGPGHRGRRNTKPAPSHSANGAAPATSSAKPCAPAQRAASARSPSGSRR
jgi:NAD(P)-dependent dehydrogenase (short-subunit alcohol dehydrogenase family)